MNTEQGQFRFPVKYFCPELFHMYPMKKGDGNSSNSDETTRYQQGCLETFTNHSPFVHDPIMNEINILFK